MSGFVHDLGNDKRCQAAARPERFVRIGDRANDGAGEVFDVLELGSCQLVGVVAAHGKAEIKLAGLCDVGIAQGQPRLAIITGKTSEGVARAL